jgi:hypothetical protein
VCSVCRHIVSICGMLLVVLYAWMCVASKGYGYPSLSDVVMYMCV